MNEYKAKLQWNRQTPDFSYDTYDRSHSVRFGSGESMEMSAAPEYKGDPKHVNPEELLVAALSSCHMLTFLALVARKRLIVDAYEDDAVGVMSKNKHGKMFVSHVTLRPKVTFQSSVDASVLAELHHHAHVECFIANSVCTEVSVQPTL